MNWEENVHSVFSATRDQCYGRKHIKTSVQDLSSTVDGEIILAKMIYIGVRKTCGMLGKTIHLSRLL